MFAVIKFIKLLIVEHVQSLLAERREARIQRQRDFVAQLGAAYDNHPFPDYLARYEAESAKLDRIQRI